MQFLLQDHFWQPDLVNLMQRILKNYERCIQHEGAQSKVPLHQIIATALLKLLHVDYTSIEMTMELDQSPKAVNILVFQDHSTKHIMAYVIPDQTTKTVAKFLYKGYISIFGALAKVLSDQRPNFMSNIIWELCELMRIKKIRTLPYHAQTNGQVEDAHQTIMQMIGKLGEDQKADQPNHLSEMVQAYNSTRSAVNGYSPHYLMFGQ